MSDPIYTGPPIGESELFQTYPEQEPAEQEPQGIQSLSEQFGIDFGTMGEVGEADIFQTFPEVQPEAQEPSLIVGPGGQVLPVGQELLAQNFPDQDPLSYDFYSALDQSYRFLSPQDLAPEGIEAVYGPTERDPFRQDWSEAEFRVPVDYEGDFLTGDEMNVVQTAYDFVGSLALEAQDAGYTSTRDYLAAMQEYEPSKYNAIANALNSYAGVIDQYGDQYKFQAALYDAEQISVDPMEREDIIRSSMDLLRDYVAAGLVSQEEAAYLAQNPVGLISLISSGDFTPQAGQAPQAPAPQAPDQQAPAPQAPAQQAPDQQAPAQQDAAQQDAGQDDGQDDAADVELDNQGREIEYADWDTEEMYPFYYDEYGQSFFPALREGERIVRSPDGDYVENVETGERVRDDHSNYFNPPPGIAAVPNDDGITAVDVPVTSEGTYDLYTDSQRALSDVADFYTGPEATLDLGEAFRTNFGSSNPVYDETLFTETERPAFYDDYPNMPVAEYQYYINVPFTPQPGGSVSGGPQLVTGERYLSRPIDADLVSYEDQPVLQYGDGFRFGGEDSEWMNEKFDELVQTRPYGRSYRAARAFAGGEFGNPWTFDIATDPLVQQSLFEALVDYSDTTGVPIERIHNSRYEDIGSWDEGNTDVFDIEHFMSGSEDSGWGGFIPIFQDLARDYGLGSVGSEQDLLGMPELERMAFLSSAVFRPLASQVDSIIEEREGGFSFDQNVSIPSEYNNRFGLRPTPDYLQNSLDVGGPENEPPGLFAEGGYIGGIAGGMDDTVPASIDGSQPAALSSGEFVVPADVVSHLGDGNNQNGAAKLYNFMDQVRTVKTGSTEQPDPFNDGIMANMIGEPYGR